MLSLALENITGSSFSVLKIMKQTEYEYYMFIHHHLHLTHVPKNMDTVSNKKVAISLEDY